MEDPLLFIMIGRIGSVLLFTCGEFLASSMPDLVQFFGDIVHACVWMDGV